LCAINRPSCYSAVFAVAEKLTQECHLFYNRIYLWADHLNGNDYGIQKNSVFIIKRSISVQLPLISTKRLHNVYTKYMIIDVIFKDTNTCTSPQTYIFNTHKCANL